MRIGKTDGTGHGGMSGYRNQWTCGEPVFELEKR